MRSYSNFSDAPSRGNCEILLKLGFRDVSELAHSCVESLLRCMIGKLGKAAAASNPTGENNALLATSFDERREEITGSHV